MILARFPRVRLGHLNTPMEYMPRLTKYLGGPDLWIKRDDCTGLAGGGNKTRKLEFLMAEAIADKADIVITQGATQSNHARQTAAAAARLGLSCHVLLEDRTSNPDTSYQENGNVLLNWLHGATHERHPGGASMPDLLNDAADRMRQAGRRPYVIPGGGSNSTGALGYVNCALEISKDCADARLEFDYIVHATGSSGTQAGLVAGLCAMNAGTPVLGIGTRAAKEKQEDMVYSLACATAERLGAPGCVKREHVMANCDYVGKGYGFPLPGTLDAISVFAQYEGILLDPVYSGKGADGLIDLCKKGYFKTGEKVLFVHTGGSVALHAYMNDFQKMKSSG